MKGKRYTTETKIRILREAQSSNRTIQDEVGEEAQGQCGAFGRATPSQRPSIDLLYDIEQIINPSRLTKALPQFG